MQVTCAYSGVVFTLPHFGSLKMQGQCRHPIFEARISQLLSRYGDWKAGLLGEDESKMLFLALLNSTDLVEFRLTAKPSPAVVANNMDSLVAFVTWHNRVTNPAVQLMRVAITKETCDLANIRHWLEGWKQNRKDFDEGYVSTTAAAKLRNTEAALERLIRSKTSQAGPYTGILARWAMDAGSVPHSLREHWTAIFKVEGLKLFDFKVVDLEEMVEHFEDNLDHGTISASATMKHLRNLLARRRAGIGADIGMSLEELATTDIVAAGKTPFTIVTDSIELENRAAAGADPTEPKPDQRDFSSRVNYLMALARWNLRNKGGK